MMHLLFYTRLILYLAVVAVPFLHPAILVPYDLSAIGQWFVVVPGMMLAAFYFSPPLLKIRYWLIVAGGFLVIASLIFGGFTLDALALAGTGLAAFFLTVLVFKTQGKGRVLAAFEIVFSGALYYAFLSFSRASKEIALASGIVMKVLFLAAVVTLFLHAVVLFVASFPRTLTGRGKRNLFIFLGVLVPAVVALSLLLPVDFINHEVRLNPLEEELDRQAEPLDEEGNSPFDGNLMDRERRAREGKLESLNREQWESLRLSRRGKGSAKQVPKMIVATDRRTLYLGNRYAGDLDPVKGLQLSADEPLNELADLRLIETWRNTTPAADLRRETARAEIFSSLEDRFLAYRPMGFTPTILDEEAWPFEYFYEAESAVSAASEAELRAAPELDAVVRRELARYLAVPFPEETTKAFRAYLDPLLKRGMTSYEKMLAILNGFRVFQYELGYDERVNTDKILAFVTTYRAGDCTEFANATAILARLAGVPSRVVTGFLATRDLQRPWHVKGLRYLQDQIEPLKRYDLNQLILVTTAHQHAWAQVYVNSYGWIDLEATAYAIPPPPSGDANERPLLLPRRGKREGTAVPASFPWLTVLVVFFIVVGGGAVLVYAVKYMRLLVLSLAARSNSLLGLKALQKLLLIRLITRGYAYKPPSRTLLEYSEKYEDLAAFAGLYTELRYRELMPDDEKRAAWHELRREYDKLARSLRPLKKGLAGALREFFSLEGFRY